RTAEKRNVVKGIMHDCLRHSARLGPIAADDEDASVVVGHRQTPIVLCFGSFWQRYGHGVSKARLEARHCSRSSIKTAVASCGRSRSNAGFSACMTPPSARQPGAPNWYMRTF